MDEASNHSPSKKKSESDVSSKIKKRFKRSVPVQRQYAALVFDLVFDNIGLMNGPEYAEYYGNIN